MNRNSPLKMPSNGVKTKCLFEEKVEESAKPEDKLNTFDITTIKHSLRDSWTLWYFRNDRTKRWEDNLMKVFTFATIEEFWGTMHYTRPASQLTPGCNYSVFKTGIPPMWENEHNLKGGRWLLKLDLHQRLLNLDRIWLEVLLFLIGAEDETVAESVNGAVLNVRGKGDKIALWMGDSEKENLIKEVGKALKDRMGIQKHIRIGFEVHLEAIKTASSTTKSKYTI